MSFKIENIAGTYAPIGSENFDEYLKHLGVPDDKIQSKCKESSIIIITVEGKKVTLHCVYDNDSGREQKHMATLILDEEVIENIGNRFEVKSIASWDDKGTMTIFSRKISGSINFEKCLKRIFKFVDDDLEVTLFSVKKGGPTARKFYKKIKC